MLLNDSGLVDTDPESQQVLNCLYREMSPARKIALVEDAIATSRSLALAGLKSRYPEADTAELHLRLFHLLLGTDLATRAYGPLPDQRCEG